MANVSEMLQERHKARMNRNYTLADIIKLWIESQGFKVRDYKDSSRAISNDWKKVHSTD